MKDMNQTFKYSDKANYLIEDLKDRYTRNKFLVLDIYLNGKGAYFRI